MNLNHPKIYEECLKSSMPELAELMANREEAGSRTNLAKLVYEEKQRDEKRKFDKDQMHLQHKLNKENIELQHSLNTQIVNKQLRLMKLTTIITSVSTLIAALAAVFLAYALTQIQRPIQIKSDPSTTLQSHIESSTSALHYEKTPDKVPLQPPIKNETNR